MINDFDLTPEEIKQQYPEDVVKKAETFKTKGVSLKEAEDYLRTEEGKLYFDRLAEADPTLAQENPKKIFDRAVGQIQSGTTLPRMETINEPLVKIVPKGQTLSPFSPYWMKESDLNAAIAEGKNLSKSFALPIGSESAQYDVYKITPKVPTEVFISTVAPSTEFDGQIIKTGGAT